MWQSIITCNRRCTINFLMDLTRPDKDCERARYGPQAVKCPRLTYTVNWPNPADGCSNIQKCLSALLLYKVLFPSGLILLFYLVFYGFLAGMFILTMWVMLQTLDENIPRYQDRVTNPGELPTPRLVRVLYSFNFLFPPHLILLKRIQTFPELLK